MLRRTANGQPAMIMYDHGAGKVIVTTMYSDWAYGHGQASAEEIALVRDMIAWAKRPATMPEAKPGGAVSLTVSVVNNTGVDAASVRLIVLDPNRNVMAEQTVGASIAAGQGATVPFTYTVPAIIPPNPPLGKGGVGIYHVDYTLIDAAGNLIQPRAETESGRLAVENR